MAIPRDELVRQVQMALNEIRIVPYDQGECSYATNGSKVELSENYTSVCSTLFTIPQSKKVCHIAFTAVISEKADVSAVVILNGVQQRKEYRVTGNTINFIDFVEFEIGTYEVSIQMKVNGGESSVCIMPRSSKLGVYL